jgi:hypothetical protein
MEPALIESALRVGGSDHRDSSRLSRPLEFALPATVVSVGTVGNAELTHFSGYSIGNIPLHLLKSAPCRMLPVGSDHPIPPGPSVMHKL